MEDSVRPPPPSTSGTMTPHDERIDYGAMHKALVCQRDTPRLLIHPDCAASRTAMLFLKITAVHAELIDATTPHGTLLTNTYDLAALPALILGSDTLSECHNILRMLATCPSKCNSGWYDEHSQAIVDLWLRWRYVCLGRAIVDYMHRRHLSVYTFSRKAEYHPKLLRCLRILEKVLRKRRYLCTQRHPTLSDLSIVSALVDLELVDLAWDKFPHLRDWYYHMVSRYSEWGVVYDRLYFKVARKRGFAKKVSADQLGFFDFFDPDWSFLDQLSSTSFQMPLTRAEERILIQTNAHAIKARIDSGEGQEQEPSFRYKLDAPINYVQIFVDGKASSILPIVRRIHELQSMCIYLQRFYPHSRLEFHDEDGKPIAFPKSSTQSAWEAVVPSICSIQVLSPVNHRNLFKPPKFNYRPLLYGSSASTDSIASAQVSVKPHVAASPKRKSTKSPRRSEGHKHMDSLPPISSSHKSPMKDAVSNQEQRSLVPHPCIPTTDFPISLPSIGVRSILPDHRW
eukprot:TRINITY_DN9390_c0_g3_i1.p1 TRINITY_DN9390_c0_g3~~TRINITY_DN9390_c0_g3_i1.p1  ORF type:complete len:512 (+),score=82.02 TRINITY_DN9390_c0_g3_i1:219-1754(+)